MKITKKKIIWSILIAVLLVGSYLYGGNYNGKNTGKESIKTPVAQKQTEENIKTEPVKEENPVKTEETEQLPPSEGEKNEEPALENKEEGNFCTISIRCDTILNNLNLLNEKKHQLVPQDGVILAETKVTFNEDESVFNVLRRETKKNKIHLEFSNTPAYNSAYIEGIGNLYEFDVGELSGWVYKINGKSPGYSSSEYILKSGDRIEWIYTCDLGRDVGATVQIAQ